MKEQEQLRNEIDLIKDAAIKQWVEETLQNAPKYFWIASASSTGKYHPECTCKEGGLIIHTKRVVFIANRLCRGWNIVSSLDKDIVIASCILHDLAKTGKNSGTYKDYVNHPINAEKYFSKSLKDINKFKVIKDCVRYHMGLWTPDSIKKPLGKYTPKELIVYTSDYMAVTKELVTPVDKLVIQKESVK